MTLPSINKNCIWCGRRLVFSGYDADCAAGFGPRPRSEEHIIPKSIFGKVITTDLCRCCNNRFGAELDIKLCSDKFIVEAASSAGIPFTQLQSRFTGIQQTSDGRPYKTEFKNGVFKPKAELRDLQKLSVVASENRIDARDLAGLKAQFVKKVTAKKPGMSPNRILAEVESLIAAIQNSPEKEHWNATIEEGFRPIPLSNQVAVPMKTRPWETHWAIAKIAFEMFHTTAAAEYQMYFTPIAKTIKEFAEKRLCDPGGEAGPGLFTFSKKPSKYATRAHVLEMALTPESFEWKIAFFGVAEWSFGRNVAPLRSPNFSQTVSIHNPLDHPATIKDQRT